MAPLRFQQLCDISRAGTRMTVRCIKPAEHNSQEIFPIHEGRDGRGRAWYWHDEDCGIV